MRRLFFWSGLLAAFLILRGAVSSSANPEGEEASPEPRRHGFLSEDFLRKLTDKLKLSADQQKKVKSVLDGSKPDMEKLEAEMKALHGRMKALAHKTKEGIRETLDMAQKDKFDEMLVRMKRRMGGHGTLKGIGGPGRHEKEIEIREVRRVGEGHEGPEKPDGPPPQDKEDDD